MNIPDKFYRVSAKALITNDEGKYLLLNETGGKGWELPGGGVEYGDDMHETIRRELLEETGFVVSEISQSPALVWSEETETKTMGTVWIMLVCYKTILKEMNLGL